MSRLVRFRPYLLALPLTLGLAACLEPEPSLDVEVEIAGVTLADEECSDAASAERFAGDCAEDGPCGGYCQQTAVQLAIEAGAGDATVPFQVVRVALHDADGRFLQTLDAGRARLFDGETYVAWDERIAPNAQLSVTYDTSAPNWEELSGGELSRTYGRSYRIVMTVRVDGVERTLEFAPAMREPQIVT